MKQYISLFFAVAFIVCICIVGKYIIKSGPLIDLSDSVRIDTSLQDHSKISDSKWSIDSVGCGSIVDGWMEMPLLYNGKVVMEWDVDTKHFGRIEEIYDTLGAIKGLIEEIKDRSKRTGSLYDQIDSLRFYLMTMHNTGKCPFGKEYHGVVTLSDFETVAGCYSPNEWLEMIDTTDQPRLEISVSASKKNK